jgi:hypothetical protein
MYRTSPYAIAATTIAVIAISSFYFMTAPTSTYGEPSTTSRMDPFSMMVGVETLPSQQFDAF